MPLIDACYNTFGSSSVTHKPTVDASANLLGSSDVAILPQSLITVAGRIASVQFYSSAAGTVNIYVSNQNSTFFQKEILMISVYISSYYVVYVHHQ